MTYVMNAALHYEQIPKIRSMTQEQYTELRMRVPSFNLPDDPGTIYDYMDVKGVVLLEDLDWLSAQGLEVRVSRLRGQAISEGNLRALQVPGAQGVQVVNISVPNASLLAVKTVRVIEDACTQFLQECLTAGWRIVAVCPPNDCRRPTYVLGHFEGEVDLP